MREEGKKEIRRESCNDYSKDQNTKSERMPMENSEDVTTVNKRDKSRRDTLDTILSSDAFSDNLNPILPHTNNEQSSKQYSSYKNVNNSNSINNSNNTRFTENGHSTTRKYSLFVLIFHYANKNSSLLISLLYKYNTTSKFNPIPFRLDIMLFFTYIHCTKAHKRNSDR